jgi:hypothetical protein
VTPRLSELKAPTLPSTHELVVLRVADDNGLIVELSPTTGR